MNELLLTQPHHDGSPLYTGTDRPAPGDDVEVRVLVPHAPDGSPGAQEVVLRTVRDGEGVYAPAQQESTGPAGTWWRATVRVHNPVTPYRFLLDGGRDYRWLNGTGVHRRDLPDASDFRLVSHPAPPDWVTDQVAYQVFPDRFARSTTRHDAPSWAQPADWDDPVLHHGDGVAEQWYGGDLDGVAAHLDHIADLGATLIYLTPFFEARSNHRYDAVSFDRVDPVLGGDAALARLLTAAHARGIRVLGDLTTNHTGSGHEWFTRAVADAGSEEAGYYRFAAHPHDYEAWLGVRSLPKLDHGSAALRRRLYGHGDSVVTRWLRAGLDGWRIDVANMTGRSGAHDRAHEVARAVREAATAARADAWLLAEHGHDASPDLMGDGWHGAMDYAGFTRPVWAWLNGGSAQGPGQRHGLHFLGAPVDVPVLPGHAAVAAAREAHATMPWRSWTASTSHLDSHDTPRFRTVAGGGTSGWIDTAGHGRDLHLLGVALQMTVPGVPALFAGDELGLTAVDGEHARTPFPWQRAAEWDALTLQGYRHWIRLRREHVALRRGGLRWVHAGEDSITYLREHPEERVLVHVARYPHAPVRLPLAALGLASAAELTVLSGEASLPSPPGTVTLPAHGPAAHAYLLPPA